MTADYPVGYEPATPEYVFGCFQQIAWLQGGEHGLSQDTPAVEFLANFSEFARPTPRFLAKCMNGMFDANISHDEWSTAFPTVRGKTVGDVIEFLAPRILRPAIRPWASPAGDCLPAGAFLTVRAWLTEFGVNPDHITPSTPLHPYYEFFAVDLRWPLTMLAPDRVTTVTYVYRPWYLRLPCAVLVGLPSAVAAVAGAVFLIIGLVLFDFPLSVLGTVHLSIGALGLRWVSRMNAPVSSNMEGLVTFRDLAYRLAGQSPRRRGQAPPLA